MNDIEFFVFEDILLQVSGRDFELFIIIIFFKVLLCFLRDQSESFGRSSYHLLSYRKFSMLGKCVHVHVHNNEYISMVSCTTLLPVSRHCEALCNVQRYAFKVWHKSRSICRRLIL